ncbi:TIGR04282 family arsenosugar biosynthesis glycosyltransferase [Clostridia bacterium]|nr:TIGR04282 family arsenosugar biosynthesis glycosyltransferase [Clostridia bacterium]
MKDKGIILFTKIPEIGKVKTRLVPFLTKEICVELQTAFIKDIYDSIREMGIDIIISYAGAGDLEVLKNIVHNDIQFIKQEGQDIGEKMYHAIASALEDYNKVILIGSDIPLIHKTDLEKAFNILEDKEMVISPTFDGGYYLIGMKTENHDIFKIEYSKSSVFEKTIENMESLGLSYGIGNILLDIDDREDLIRLYNALKSDEHIACCNTRKIVNQIMESNEENE